MSRTRAEAVFLDRDGTIIEEVNYLERTDQVKLIPGAGQAISALNESGVRVVVVTNQAGVARGKFPEIRVAEIHAFLADELARCGAHVDAFYYCPHHATAGIGVYRVDCECRKPKPGMLQTAAADLNLDLAKSAMIGDKLCDAWAGAAAGCQTFLVRTGHGVSLPQTGLPGELRLAGIVPDLPAAVDLWSRMRGHIHNQAA